MNTLVGLGLIVGVMYTSPVAVFGGQEPSASGTIIGRVRVDDRPAPGVVVIAHRQAADGIQKSVADYVKSAPSHKAKTDSDGRYRIENLGPGDYTVRTSSRVLVAAAPTHREVSVQGGKTVEDVDFSLARGAVITGKITDADGSPVIGERIQLRLDSPDDDPTKSQIGAYAAFGDRMYLTDDRGIYRVYGLTPGEYTVSAGGPEAARYQMFHKRPQRARTYYPGTLDATRAKLVEVVAGGEATNVDIRFDVADKGFTVSGRIIDAETRAPVSGAMISYRRRSADSNEPRADDHSDDNPIGLGGFTTTNAKGEFQFESVQPGSYKAETMSLGAWSGTSDFYADPINFDVQSSNVDKLEIKVQRGASISGVVVIESAGEPNSTEQLGSLMLYTVPPDGARQGPLGGVSMGRVAADGSFRIGALRPGKTNLSIQSAGDKLFSVLRIERNGVEQHDGLHIQENEQIGGVRVVLALADCIIRGQVTLHGDSIPDDPDIVVTFKPPGSLSQDEIEADVDEKGNFTAVGLAPGAYEIEAYVLDDDDQRIGSVKQTVTVARGTNSEVTLVVPVTAKKKDH